MNLTISTNLKAKQLTLTLTDMDWERLEQGNFYQGEQEVRSLLNTIGRELTRQLLERKAGRDLTIEHGGGDLVSQGGECRSLSHALRAAHPPAAHLPDRREWPNLLPLGR